MTIFTLVFSFFLLPFGRSSIYTMYKNMLQKCYMRRRHQHGKHTHTELRSKLKHSIVPMCVCVFVTSKAIIVEIAITISIMLFHHYYSFFSCSLSLPLFLSLSHSLALSVYVLWRLFLIYVCIQRSFVCSVSFLVFPLVPCAFFNINFYFFFLSFISTRWFEKYFKLLTHIMHIPRELCSIRKKCS